MIETQSTMSNSQFALIMSVIYVPVTGFMVWLYAGKPIRRWLRRRKLKIPESENNVKTITGPVWEVAWVKVSEVGQKYPEEQRSTVLGNDLPEVLQVLRAKFGNEFQEKNIRRASKQNYFDVIVGIPESSN